MNDIKALEAKYKELGAEIEALKESKKVKEWPQNGDEYFALLGNGNFYKHIYWSDNADYGYKAINNIFRTKEDAAKELETRKTIAELRAQPGRKKFLSNTNNICIDVAFDVCEVRVNYWGCVDRGFASTYFESQKAVEDAINTVGEARILAAAKWLAMGE
jgi:hypothetical protein